MCCVLDVRVLQDALQARAAAAEQQLNDANAAVDKELAAATAAVVCGCGGGGGREGDMGHA